MLLIINTALENKLKIILAKSADIFFEKNIKGDYKTSEKLLSAVNLLLEKNNLNINDLSGIIYINGKGSFTALRISAVVSNVLGYALKIPVASISFKNIKNNKDLLDKAFKTISVKKKKKYTMSENIVLPEYEGEPNIN